MNTDTQNTTIDFALLGHPASYEHMGDIFIHSLFMHSSDFASFV